MGQQLNIYNNHKILPVHFNTDRVLRLKLILEYYDAKIEYIQDTNYIVVYAPINQQWESNNHA